LALAILEREVSLKILVFFIRLLIHSLLQSSCSLQLFFCKKYGWAVAKSLPSSTLVVGLGVVAAVSFKEMIGAERHLPSALRQFRS